MLEARTYSAFCTHQLANAQKRPAARDILVRLRNQRRQNGEERMTYRWIMLATVAFLVFTASCTKEKSGGSNASGNRSTAQSTPDQFAQARTLFEKNCQTCHGSNGEGGPVKLEDGTKLKVPSLREGHALRHPDADFVKQITKGGDGMPAFGEKLKTEEINDLIKFIRHEFQGGMTPPAEPMKSPMKGMK
jgi:mono/diheme cytochrome c family protein